MENGPWESALASATSSLQATPEALSSCVSVGFGFLHPRKVSKQLRGKKKSMHFRVRSLGLEPAPPLTRRVTLGSLPIPAP